LRRTGLPVIDSRGTELRLDERVQVEVLELATSADPAAANGVSPLLLSPEGLLPDWHDDWVSSEREQIRRCRLHTLEVRCAALIVARRPDEAVAAWRAAVAVEPLRESAQRVLIEAYLAQRERRGGATAIRPLPRPAPAPTLARARAAHRRSADSLTRP
jgi:DNA-binding SARP family transcriptional activator